MTCPGCQQDNPLQPTLPGVQCSPRDRISGLAILERRAVHAVGSRSSEQFPHGRHLDLRTYAVTKADTILLGAGNLGQRGQPALRDIAVPRAGRGREPAEADRDT